MARVRLLLLSAVVAFTPARAHAYSVLAHEANIDAVWDVAIVPVLRQRFPATSTVELANARAYAYGGCVIQDLGYYPFGSHFFSDLLHYVRTGDFVVHMIRDARTVDELAFALGALAHYAADNNGHPLAVNRSVPIEYPWLRRKFGDRVTYEDSPKAHVLVEFSFDVVQVATGGYQSEAYHKFIGFEVAMPALERAFHETYGLELRDLFGNVDLAIGTYRHAVSSIIPEMTKVAWRDKREEIQRIAPRVEESTFLFHLSPQDYEDEFGSDYAKPKWWARLLGFLFKLLPKIGPFRVLTYKVPTPQAEQYFLASLAATRERFRADLADVQRGRLTLANRDLDTGLNTRRGEYHRADDTYATLVKKLADRKCGALPPDVDRDIGAFYANSTLDKKLSRRLSKMRRARNSSCSDDE